MEYMTIKEIAKKMDVSEETVRRWIRDKKLLAEDMGGRLGYRVALEDLRKFIDNRAWSDKGKDILGIASSVGTGAMTGLSIGARVGLLSGPVGAIVGGIVGGVVGQTLTRLVNDNETMSDKEKRQEMLKLESRKYEIEQTKIALEAQIKSLDAELNTINRLLTRGDKSRL